MIIPAKYSVARVVETIKGNTNKSPGEKFGFLSKLYWNNKGIGGKDYFVSAVGINEEMVKKIRRNVRKGRCRTSGA